MTGPRRPEGGRRLVSMSTVSVRVAGGPTDRDDDRPADGNGRAGNGANGHNGNGHNGATVPRRPRGMRRPAPEWESPTTALASPTGPHAPHYPEPQYPEPHYPEPQPAEPQATPEAPAEHDDAVTETLAHHQGGAVTGLPTTPSRIPLPTAGTSGSAQGADEVRQRERRPDQAATTSFSEPTTPAPAAQVRAPAPDTDDDGGALGGLLPASSDEPNPFDEETYDEDTRRRRRLVWPLIAGVLVLALAGGAFFARDFWGVFFPPDFAGPGTGHVVIQVADGDSTRDIGETLVSDGVVASARGFGDAAEDDPRGRGIQPGFYDMQRGMPAATAVNRMLDPTNRLGRLEVRGGTQLDDTAGAGTARVPGVLSSISQATCLVEDSGTRRCTSVDDLRRAMETTDPARLGVPDWALADVRRAVPERRLEGLIAPGTYDVAPGTDAATALTSVVRTSASRLESNGVVTKAAANNVSPYQALIVGSLAEREGVEQDFGKIARVVYNRLPIPMRLQLDSTINYPLDRQTLLTTPLDRAAPGPYNTYLNFGLPPTPIGAVSTPALQAALSPDPGGWVYFVKCQPDGASCFAVTPAEHDANRRLAQSRGAY